MERLNARFRRFWDVQNRDRMRVEKGGLSLTPAFADQIQRRRIYRLEQ